jgi:hypothetical protein
LEKGTDYDFIKKILEENFGVKVADKVIEDLKSKNLTRFDVEKNKDLDEYNDIIVFNSYTVKYLRKDGFKERNDKNLAPNGKPSNLTTEQYKLVRTPQFKAWFGDWEKDPQNASQVLDDNGEPLVVYRGDISSSKKGNIFKTGFNRLKFIRKDRLPNDYFFYFIDKFHVANGYATNQIDEHNLDIVTYGKKGKIWYPEVKPYFLNIRKPLDLTPRNHNFPTYDEYFKLHEKYYDISIVLSYC